MNKPSLLTLFLVLLVIGVSLPPTASAQAMIWRFVSGFPGGKTYLNTETRVLADKNKLVWEKATKADASFVISLVKWNCPDKTRLVRQTTYYNPDRSNVGTKKAGYEWTSVIPGSTGDFLYTRVCLPPVLAQWAQITVKRAALRSFAGDDAPVIRIAAFGERFQTVPETGLGGWFCVVDAGTQEDYWVKDDSFKSFVLVPVPRKRETAEPKPPAIDSRVRQRGAGDL